MNDPAMYPKLQLLTPSLHLQFRRRLLRQPDLMFYHTQLKAIGQPFTSLFAPPVQFTAQGLFLNGLKSISKPK